MSEWIGFNRLRKGRIHLFCPGCKRKMSNMPRTNVDPPRAVLCHVYCDRCADGAKDPPVDYFTARGRRMSFDEVERAYARGMKAVGANTTAKQAVFPGEPR